MMRWWRRHSDDAQQGGACEVSSEATRARVKAEHDLAATRRDLLVVRSQTPGMAELAGKLKRIREDNHLALAFAKTMRSR